MGLLIGLVLIIAVLALSLCRMASVTGQLEERMYERR